MDLVVAEFRVGLAGAESRTQWAAVEYLTASAAAEYVSVVRLILAVVRLILRRARAAVCMSAADVSGADLVSVPHHTSVVGTPNQGPHQGQVSTVSVQSRRTAIGWPAMERRQTQVETPRSAEIGTQQTSLEAGTSRV
jgi:hypothetical protein